MRRFLALSLVFSALLLLARLTAGIGSSRITFSLFSLRQSLGKLAFTPLTDLKWRSWGMWLKIAVRVPYILLFQVLYCFVLFCALFIWDDLDHQ